MDLKDFGPFKLDAAVAKLQVLDSQNGIQNAEETLGFFVYMAQGELSALEKSEQRPTLGLDNREC